MRGSFLLAVLALQPVLSTGVLAQGTPVPAQAAAPAADDADPLARANATIQQLTVQLSAAQAEIARLQPIASEAAQNKQFADVCTAKNVRLVRAGEAILASYRDRYGRGFPGALQLGRRAFEEEAQRLGDRLYDNRYDVPVAQQRPEPSDSAPSRDK